MDLGAVTQLKLEPGWTLRSKVAHKVSWHVLVTYRAQEPADRVRPHRGRPEVGRRRVWPAMH